MYTYIYIFTTLVWDACSSCISTQHGRESDFPDVFPKNFRIVSDVGWSGCYILFGQHNFPEGLCLERRKIANDFGKCDSTLTSAITTTCLAHPNIFVRRLAIVFAILSKTRASGSCSSQLGFEMFQDTWRVLYAIYTFKVFHSSLNWKGMVIWWNISKNRSQVPGNSPYWLSFGGWM